VTAVALACDLCVVGSGMAGMSAAVFAARRGLSTALVGRTGEIIFASGLLDLMGVHPVEEGLLWEDPWACVERVKTDLPLHPFARLTAAAIRSAFRELEEFLEATGLAYTGHPGRNARVLTPVGTFKATFRVPRTVWEGVEVCRRRDPCLLLDICGLKGFSARQIAEAVGGEWPGLRTARIALPGHQAGGEVFAERLARSLEVPANREPFAEAVRPHLQGARAVGLPAVLGVSEPFRVMRDLQDRLGAPVFEIPTMPPGISGLRLKEAFESGLKALGARLFLENRVFRAAPGPEGGFRLDLGREEPEAVILARSVVLATGRFMGGGLRADRRRVRETLFDLPVHQPPGRSNWHREDFLDRRGHPVNRSGLEIDSCFRPLDAGGRPAHPRLFAAGSILAHQDWMRMKCGSGLALATAHAAVENAVAGLEKP
jgi:glycerol-3-phosphate dehydrogenase subunit B